MTKQRHMALINQVTQQESLLTSYFTYHRIQEYITSYFNKIDHHIFISETNQHIVLTMFKFIIYISYCTISFFIHKNLLLKLPSSLSSAMLWWSRIPLRRLSKTPQLIIVRLQSFSQFYLLGTSCPNRHTLHELTWNPVS